MFVKLFYNNGTQIQAVFFQNKVLLLYQSSDDKIKKVFWFLLYNHQSATYLSHSLLLTAMYGS